MSSGHMEQAQAVLVTASEQVPVEHVVAALEAMGTVAQHVEQVGGGDGQEAVRRSNRPAPTWKTRSRNLPNCGRNSRQ